ncbi:MAG: hypothetical protein QM638_01105 [Nocardioides sp.]|uniref:hypothetical protein n=1 Tax=Nocardioides sp. TaxID=35761 RepID=UPI0039E2AB82
MTAFATPSPDDFMAAAPKSVSGSTPWASRYAAELRRVILEHAARAPRTLQQHLGPSELGVACDRQVVGKMAALPTTNHVADPWPSIVGTACHAWAERAFDADNMRGGLLRWVTETRVSPHPDHPGTADLYDAAEQAVVDHKFLGESSMAKVRKDPPRKYVRQLLLYGLGYWKLGLPVRRVVLAAYPRTAATLDGLYVWEHAFADEQGVIVPEALAALESTFAETAHRRALADELLAGRLRIEDVAAEPDSSECYFCPFYRPQAAKDGGAGCPGTSTQGPYALPQGGAS